MRCSSSQPLAICPPVNAIKKSLPSKKKKKRRRKKKGQSELLSFLNFFIRLHHLEGGGSSITQLRRVPVMQTLLCPSAQKILPYPCCNQGGSTETQAAEKISLSLCELLSRWAKDMTLTRGPPPGASSCACALIKFTLSLVVTSYLAREVFPGLQCDNWCIKPLISLLLGY